MTTYSDSFGNRIEKSVIDRRVKIAKKQLLQNQIDEHGYNFCEECKRSSGVYLDCSHNVSVKECQESGRSELAYDVNNMEVLCRTCHQIKDKTN